MMYLLFTADSFMQSALDEIGKAARYGILDSQRNILLIESEETRIEKFEDMKFVYGAFPIHCKSDLDYEDYLGSLYRGIASLNLERNKRLKLECFDINCKIGKSAKDIEVAVGKMLESGGYNINIIAPEVLAYVVLLNGKSYFGSMKLGGRYGFVNPFRIYKSKNVSRSEFKIIESFSEFGIKTPGLVVDIGAAPGGWSAFLAGKGAAVVAVDSADLDYESIGRLGLCCNVSQDKSKVDLDNLKGGCILHLKMRSEDAIGLLPREAADMLVDDMNVGGIDSAETVIKISGALKRGAVLIMTLKCMHRNVMAYISEVEEGINKEFEVKRWKVLPHNRQEITLFAIKR